MIRPLFNMCKIEIIDDYAGVIRNTGEEQVQKGVLRDYALMSDHLTASVGYRLSDPAGVYDQVVSLVGKVVHYAQYADSGQVIEEDGKKYAFVPFYRLIAAEE